MKNKNIVALILGLAGAIAGIVGGFIWAGFAKTCANATENVSAYTAGFTILGIGGAVVALLGAINSYSYKRSGFILSLIALGMEVGQFALACACIKQFDILVNFFTVICIILLTLTAFFAFRKQPEDEVKKVEADKNSAQPEQIRYAFGDPDKINRDEENK